EGISIAPNMQPMTVTLSVGKITQQVDVQEDANQISIDPESNQTALVLKEEDIQSLPDDEDELLPYLTELAGPRAAAACGLQVIMMAFSEAGFLPKTKFARFELITIRSQPNTAGRASGVLKS